MKKREVCNILAKAYKKNGVTKERYFEIKEGMQRIDDKDTIFSSVYLRKVWEEIR